MEASPEPAGSPSNGTLPKPKSSAKNAGKGRNGKSPKRSAKKAVAKKKPAKKRAKPSKRAVAKKAKIKKSKGGRPMMFPDKTIMRMPAGYLKAINARANKKKQTQGEYLRGVIGRAIGK